MSEDQEEKRYLSTSGRLVTNSKPVEGLVASFRNEPSRGREWKMESACFHQLSGDYALSDEKGQVFYCCPETNLYHVVRAASTVVSAMEFVQSRQNQLIISYEQSNTLIVDTVSREIIQNVQPQSDGNVRLMRTHSTKPLLALVTDSQIIELWDLKTCHCARTLDCAERIMAVDFIHSGSLLLVALEHTGTYLYKSDDWSLVTRCSLPQSERLPGWTGSIGWSFYPGHEGEISKKSKAGRKGVLGAPVASNAAFVCMSADNGMLYLWAVDGLPSDQSAKFSHPDFKSKNANQEPSTVLVGIIELPVKIRMAVGFAHVGDAQHPPRLVLLSNAGGILIVDVTDYNSLHIGNWTVVADIPPARVQGSKTFAERETVYPMFIPPDYTRFGEDNVQRRKDGLLTSCKDNFIIIGADGAAKYFDSECAIGVGEICGLGLRTRKPYSTSSATQSLNKRTDLSSIKRKAILGIENTDPITRKSRTSGGDKEKPRPSSAPAQRHKTEEVMKPLANTARPILSASSSRNRTESSSYRTTPRLPNNYAAPKSSHVAISKKKPTDSKSSSQDDPSTMPLFKLARLTKREQRVNTLKLTSFLEKHGEYPSKYRTLIWRFLLQLPENVDAYSDLVQRGGHPAFDMLHRQYPISADRLFTRLHQTCSQLAHWSPIFGELSYLPAFVFPFVVVFGSDELSILETVMTILMWWGYSWHATFPNPPLHISDGIEQLLKYYDEPLYSHLKRLNVSPGLMGWTMLSSLFTEILSREDWLKLMDYVFTHFGNAKIMLAAPVAIIKTIRTSLLLAGDSTHLLSYYRHQQGLNIKEVIDNIHILCENTPAKYFAACPQENLTTALNEEADRRKRGKTLAPQEESDNRVAAQENMALHVGNPVFPLSTGRYPAYDGHPRFLVDWELKKRDKALALQQEVDRREDVLLALQSKIRKMEDEHGHWMARHQAATDAEIMHRKSLMEAERKHLLELQAIEQEISRQRIQALNVLEITASEEMEMMDKLAYDAQKLLADSEAHMHEKMELTLNIQKHRELAEAADALTHEKLNRISMRRARDEWIKSMATTVRGKEEEMEAQNLLLQESWHKQDDELREQRNQRSAKAKAFAQNEELDRLHDELSTRMQRLHLAREMKVLDIERARALRLSKEQAEEAMEAGERSALLLKKHELAKSAEGAAWLAESTVHQAHQRLADTADLVKKESQKLLEAERVHEIRQQQAQQQARIALLRKEWADKQGQQLRDILDAETDMQQQLLSLQKASIKSEVFQSVSANEFDSHSGDLLDRVSRVDAKAMASAKADIEQLGDEILQRQRSRFEEIRGEITRQGKQLSSTILNERQSMSQQESSRDGRRTDKKASERAASRGASSSGSGAEENRSPKATSNPRWFASPDEPVPHPQQSGRGNGQRYDHTAAIESIDISNTVRRNYDVREKYSKSHLVDASPPVSDASEKSIKSSESNRVLSMSAALREASSQLANDARIGEKKYTQSNSDSDGTIDIVAAATNAAAAMRSNRLKALEEKRGRGAPSGSRLVSRLESSPSSGVSSPEDRLFSDEHDRHEARVSMARNHQFDEFLSSGGIGKEAGLRSPRAAATASVPSTVYHPRDPVDPPSGYSAPWALDNGSDSSTKS